MWRKSIVHNLIKRSDKCAKFINKKSTEFDRILFSIKLHIKCTSDFCFPCAKRKRREPLNSARHPSSMRKPRPAEPPEDARTHLRPHSSPRHQVEVGATGNWAERRLRTTSSNQLRAIQLEKVEGEKWLLRTDRGRELGRKPARRPTAMETAFSHTLLSLAFNKSLGKVLFSKSTFIFLKN